MKRKIYQRLASALQARANCANSGNDEWFVKHTQTIIDIVRNHLPSGSGIDSGTSFDFIKSKPNRLVLTAPYHHMNGDGFYDGWTDHEIIVTPDLAFDIDIRVTGRNKNAIKGYLAEVFDEALRREIGDVKLQDVA